MKNYLVSIHIESESPSEARQAIERFGLKAWDVRLINDQRTLSQNRALHKYCELLEQEAYNSGQTMEMLFRKPADVPLNRHIFKDFIREVGRVMFHRTSTADLTKQELNEVIATCQKAFAERLGIGIDFPSLDSLIEMYE